MPDVGQQDASDQEWLLRFEQCWATVAQHNPNLVMQWFARHAPQQPRLLNELSALPLEPWSCNLLAGLANIDLATQSVLLAIDQFIALHAIALAEQAGETAINAAQTNSNMFLVS